ncbi:MAG: acyltransferase family protein [Synechococcaceae cyanobacterium]
MVAAPSSAAPGAAPPPAAPASHFRYRPDVDALRGIAVLAVLIFHLNKAWLPGGFVGVDIFFVISGYVVTGSFLNHAAEPLLLRFGTFYLRRIRRLLPNLLLCIGVTSVAVALLIPDYENGLFLLTGLKSLFAWSNNFLLSSANNYFDGDAERNPFLHTWSLGVEEQFYLVFPLIFVLFGFGARRTLPLLAATVALSFGVSWLWTQQEPMRAFFLMPSRFWELAVGGVLLLIQRRPWSARWPRGRWLRLAGGSILAMALVLTSETEGFPAPGALPAVLGTLLLIQAGPGDNGRFLPFRWLERFLLACGILSYSLYLWHWPVITLTRRTLGLELPWQYAFAILLTLLLAGLAYALVERPVRRHPLPAALQTLLAATAIGLSWFGLDALYFHYRQRLFLGASVTAVPPHELIHRLDPAIAGTGINAANCSIGAWVPYGAASRTNFALCSKPGRPGAGELFLIGDSHAQHLLPMLDRATDRTGQAISFSFKGACLFSSSMTILWRGKPYETCRQFIAGEMERSRQRLKRGDVIVVAGSFNYYFSVRQKSATSPGAPILRHGRRLSADEAREGFIRDIRSYAAQLAPLGVNLVLVADVPILAQEIISCNRWQPSIPGLGRGSPCSFPANETRSMHAIMLHTLQLAAAGLPNVFVFDPTPWLLNSSGDGRVRYRLQNGRFLYWDTNHLTVTGSTLLADPFHRFLLQKHLAPLGR